MHRQGKIIGIPKKVVFKNLVPFSHFTTEINNTQVDNVKDFDVIMPMYNLIEYVVFIQ